MTARDAFAFEGKVLPFRRRSAAVRVRRRNPWLALLGPFLQALVLVGTPIALGLWLFSSPSFALAHVEVKGNQRVDARWLDRTLAPLGGSNLFELSIPLVQRLIGVNPWIAQVTVEKRLPNTLRLAVIERRPAALLRTVDGLSVLDADGKVIAPWQPNLGAENLLLVSVGTTSEVDLSGALAVAGELGRVEPDWAATLSEVEVLSDDDFRLYLGALPFPLAVRAGTLAARLPVLRSLLPELERRYPGLASVDLRFERRIVFQPVVERS